MTTLALEVDMLLCPVHGEAFREKWPLGVQPYVMHALDALSKQGEYMMDLNDYARAHGVTLAAATPPLLAARPACCRLGPDALHAAYVAIHADRRHSPWFPHVCYVCKQPGHGGLQRVPVEGGPPRATMARFVCTSCAARRPPLSDYPWPPAPLPPRGSPSLR